MGILQESKRNPIGILLESNRNPIGNQQESDGNPSGIQQESEGIQQESDRNPTGIQEDSSRNPIGIQLEPNRNPLGRGWIADLLDLLFLPAAFEPKGYPEAPGGFRKVPGDWSRPNLIRGCGEPRRPVTDKLVDTFPQRSLLSILEHSPLIVNVGESGSIWVCTIIWQLRHKSGHGLGYVDRTITIHSFCTHRISYRALFAYT